MSVEKSECSECEHPVRVATVRVVAARPAIRRVMGMFFSSGMGPQRSLLRPES